LTSFNASSIPSTSLRFGAKSLCESSDENILRSIFEDDEILVSLLKGRTTFLHLADADAAAIIIVDDPVVVDKALLAFEVHTLAFPLTTRLRRTHELIVGKEERKVEVNIIIMIANGRIEEVREREMCIDVDGERFVRS
jgi:hypothetical protein